jgi:hypothetical protein
LNGSIINDRHDLIRKFEQFMSDYAVYEDNEIEFREYHGGLVIRALDQFDICLHQILSDVLRELLRFQRHCGEIKRYTYDRLDAAGRGLRDSIEHSCARLLQSFNTGVASVHFEKLKLQEERWFHNFGQACTDIANTRDAFLASKEAMDREVTRYVEEKITSNRDETKFLLEILATETANVMDMFNSNRITSNGLRYAAENKWQGVLRNNVVLCEKNRQAAVTTPSIEKDALIEISFVLRDAKKACRDIVLASSRETKNVIYTIEETRRSHKDHMDGLIKDTRKSWNEVRAEITPLAGNYEKEFSRELSLMKSRCIDIISKYVSDETAYLMDIMLHERGSIISSFRKHFSTFDLHENELFANFNREVQHTINEFVRMWGPVKPFHLATFGDGLQRISLNYIDDLQKHIFETYGTIDVSDDSILSRMEIADILFCALDACVLSGAELPALYAEERKNQLQSIHDMSLSAGDDINKPQVAAVLDVLIRGLEIEGKVNEGYDNMFSLTKKKGGILSQDLDEFMDKYLNENAQSAAVFAKGLVDRIHSRGLEVAALLDAGVAHILADHSRLNVDTAAAVKEIDVWEQEQYTVIDETFEKVGEEMLKPVWPTPPGSPRPDEVQLAAIKRDEATQRANELIAQMEEKNYSNDGDAVVDVAELGKNWLQCLTKSGKVFFYNTSSGQSLWNRPLDLPPLNPGEKDFAYDGDDAREFITPRDDLDAPASSFIQRRDHDSLHQKQEVNKDQIVTDVINSSVYNANLVVEAAIASIKSAARIVDNDLVYFKEGFHQPVSPTASIAKADEGSSGLLRLGMGNSFMSDSGSVSSMSFTAERPAPFIVTRESLEATKAQNKRDSDLKKETRFNFESPTPDNQSLNPASKRSTDDASPAWSSLKASLDAKLENVALLETSEVGTSLHTAVPSKEPSLFEQWDALSPSRPLNQPVRGFDDTVSEKIDDVDRHEDSHRSDDVAPEVTVTDKDATETAENFIECYTEDGLLYYYNERTGESVWSLPYTNEFTEPENSTPDEPEDDIPNDLSMKNSTHIDIVGDIAQLEKQIMDAKESFLKPEVPDSTVDAVDVVQNIIQTEYTEKEPPEETKQQPYEAPIQSLLPAASEVTIGSMLTNSQIKEAVLLDDNINMTEDVAELTTFFRACSLGRTTAKKAAVNAVQNDVPTVKKLTKMWAKGKTNNNKGIIFITYCI